MQEPSKPLFVAKQHYSGMKPAGFKLQNDFF